MENFSKAFWLLVAPVAIVCGCGLFALQALAQSNDRISATIDCRAGCQGNPRGCQESLTHAITLQAPVGYHVRPETLSVQNRYNASDSPGLQNEPEWFISRYPANSNRPRYISVSPNKNTCVGRSPHTQGVTFFVWGVSIAPGPPDTSSPPATSSSGGSSTNERPTVRSETPGSAILLFFTNQSTRNFRCQVSYGWQHLRFGNPIRGTETFSVLVPAGSRDALLSRFSGSYVNLRLTTRVSLSCN
jgi:hypothetical protein